MTLICQTKLPPQRSATHLLFSFHKDGRTVCGRALSPELQIPAVSAAHAGSYWCEATTEDSQVWKQSPRLEVRVQGEFTCVKWGAGWLAPELGFCVSGVTRMQRRQGQWARGPGDGRAHIGDLSLRPWQLLAKPRLSPPHSCCPWALRSQSDFRALVRIRHPDEDEATCVCAQLWEPVQKAARALAHTQGGVQGTEGLGAMS